MLNKDRQTATFQSQEMSELIYGTRERYQTFLQNQKYFDTEPSFKVDFNAYNQSRQDNVLVTVDKTIKVREFKNMANMEDWDAQVLCPQGIFASTVHLAMVIPAFQVLASDEQIEHWMPSLVNFKALGCYAQTELAHGSDVQNLQTTATFDQSSGDFIINTPTIEATKFWPGELGLYCNHALVFCQMIVNNTNYGVQPFFCRIRDGRSHQPLPGIKAGDIGPKLGYVTKDNGYLSFDHFRIPGNSLLARYINVSRDGKVELKGNPKVLYGSMMIMRNILCDIYTRFAGQALTIAIRYSLYRKQFKDLDGNEIQVLEYQTQQAKLFPLLAEYYACIFGSLKIKALVQENFEKVTKNDFTQLGLTHALLSGAKANYTYFVSNCAEWCRLSCGGHGFAHYSGLPIIYFETTPNITLEGENTILNLQLARFILKQLKHVQTKPDSVPDLFKFLFHQPTGVQSDLTSLTSLLHLLASNCHSLFLSAAMKLMSTGNPKEAWNTIAGISLVKAASSFIPYFNLVQFIDVINHKSNTTKQILIVLARLYGINQILINVQGLLIKNLLTSEQIKELQTVREQLLSEIRPNALALVECQGYSDNTLKSLIGPHDGNIYENMFNFASKQNSMTQSSVSDGLAHIKKMKEINAKL